MSSNAKFRLFLLAPFAVGLFFTLSLPVQAMEEYTISDEFNGCEHGKLYELDGGLILECQEYNYFYEYRPSVIARGREVVLIGDEKIDGYIHDGSVHSTYISDEFEGCDFDKVYTLDNGLIFQCNTYSYTYSYRPKVKVFIINGRRPIIFIGGKKYSGTLNKG
jgi:hypothetical protein